jgi:hypothetical protein
MWPMWRFYWAIPSLVSALFSFASLSCIIICDDKKYLYQKYLCVWFILDIIQSTIWLAAKQYCVPKFTIFLTGLIGKTVIPLDLMYRLHYRMRFPFLKPWPLLKYISATLAGYLFLIAILVNYAAPVYKISCPSEHAVLSFQDATASITAVWLFLTITLFIVSTSAIYLAFRIWLSIRAIEATFIDTLRTRVLTYATLYIINSLSLLVLSIVAVTYRMSEHIIITDIAGLVVCSSGASMAILYMLTRKSAMYIANRLSLLSLSSFPSPEREHGLVESIYSRSHLTDTDYGGRS